jgi:hypothetical protein
MDDVGIQQIRILYKAWPDLCQFVGVDTIRDIVEYPEAKPSIPKGGANFDLTAAIAILASSLSIVANILSIIARERGKKNALPSAAQISVEINNQNITIENLTVSDMNRLIAVALAESKK